MLEGLVRSIECTGSATATPESDGKCHRRTRVPPPCNKLTEGAAVTPEVDKRCHQIMKSCRKVSSTSWKWTEVPLKHQLLTKGPIDAPKTDERSSTCSEVNGRFLCPSNSCRQVASMLQKWTEGATTSSKIARRSRRRTASGQKVQMKCQKCCHCTKSSPEVLLSHQKYFLQTRSASTKPKVFPPSWKYFKGIKSTLAKVGHSINFLCDHGTFRQLSVQPRDLP